MSASRSGPSRHLHPRQRGRWQLYLLRHWRQVEARRLLWHSLANRWRQIRGRKPAPSPVPVEPRHWLRPGDILLDAGGAELFWLQKTARALLCGPAPAIAYRSDMRLTAVFGYHPVETVWWLEQVGYQVWLLAAEGPRPRPTNWYIRPDEGAPAPWLLAVPLDALRAAP